jgi:hypothetical protein
LNAAASTSTVVAIPKSPGRSGEQDSSNSPHALLSLPELWLDSMSEIAVAILDKFHPHIKTQAGRRPRRLQL